MKVLVTGAAGFIGSYLAEGLLRKALQARASMHHNSPGWQYNLQKLASNVRGGLDVLARKAGKPLDAVDDPETRSDVV